MFLIALSNFSRYRKKSASAMCMFLWKLALLWSAARCKDLFQRSLMWPLSKVVEQLHLKHLKESLKM